MSTESQTPVDPRVQVSPQHIVATLIVMFIVVVVQIELEKLNTATDNINKYEVELDVSYRFFSSLLRAHPTQAQHPTPPLPHTTLAFYITD